MTVTPAAVRVASDLALSDSIISHGQESLSRPLFVSNLPMNVTCHSKSMAYYLCKVRIFCSRNANLIRIGILINALAAFACALWFGMNSDQDNVPEILNQLIPAGHATCRSATVFECSSCLSCNHKVNSSLSMELDPTSAPQWSFQYPRDANDESLSQPQCDKSFPGLFQDINRAVTFWNSAGGISPQHLDKMSISNGMARARISKGQFYIIETRSKGEDHRKKILGVLSSMHRALISAPSRNAIPDIEFTFSVEDLISDVVSRDAPVWALTRKASEEAAWLIPDFGLWAWDQKDIHIGPYSEFVETVIDLESRDPGLKEKQMKLVWRGKLSFAPKLRRALLEVARGQSWGNVKELVWIRKGNYLSMEDHCRYMFIAHVEGRSYSASLKYRQACRSVVIAHKLQYIQHHHYLLSSSGLYQNFVEVERDFSDLPAKMANLVANPAEAQRIADNSVKTFRERYLTMAAEACYWRSLWRGWAEAVGERGEEWGEYRKGAAKGLRYESFVLLESKETRGFKAM